MKINECHMLQRISQMFKIFIVTFHTRTILVCATRLPVCAYGTTFLISYSVGCMKNSMSKILFIDNRCYINQSFRGPRTDFALYIYIYTYVRTLIYYIISRKTSDLHKRNIIYKCE